MATQSSPPELPDPEALADTFHVYEIDRTAEDGVRITASH